MLTKYPILRPLHELSLHPAVKYQVITVRTLLILLSTHFGYHCWELDLVFAAYMLFVFRSKTVVLVMLFLWAFGQITHLNRVLSTESAMLEVMMLCWLGFEKGEPAVEGRRGELQDTGEVGGGLPLPDSTLPVQLTEVNPIEWAMLGRFPINLQQLPSYHFLAE